MKRVVFLINSLAGGGAERSIVNLIAFSGDWLGRYEAHLVLLDRETEAYAPPAGVTVHRLDARKKLLPSILQLRRLLATLRPDVVVSALTRSNLASVVTAQLSGHRTVICEHAHTGGHHHGLGGRIAKGLVRHLYPRADAVIGVSQDIVDELIGNFGVRRERTAVVPNPIDGEDIRRKADEPSPVGDRRPYVLGMGRLVESKNFPLLVEAFAASSFPGTLVILGQGPERERIEATIARLSLGDRVQLLGFSANPFPVVRGAAGYVLCSNAEGLPTGLIEAMIVGIPVIATNCRSGPSEILDEVTFADVKDVHQAKYGILVPTNEAGPMSRAISMLDDPAVCADLAARARAGTARYALDKTIATYQRIIEGLAEGRTAR